MGQKVKDVLSRSIKTFIQSSMSYLIACLSAQDLFQDQTNLEKALVSVGVGALAAGICAVWNGIISPWLDSAQKNGDDCEDE